MEYKPLVTANNNSQTVVTKFETVFGTSIKELLKQLITAVRQLLQNLKQEKGYKIYLT